MRQIHSYVVRVYRRDQERLAGLVENVRNGRSAPFRSLPELCDLLSGRKPFSRARRTAGDEGGGSRHGD